jgi:transcription antitermination factor NusG
MTDEETMVKPELVHWHVLHVMANHEKRVALQLSLRSIEHYLPLYAERSRWSDRTVTLERPLFPGYVFVRFSLETRLPVLSTPGVLKILGKRGAEKVDYSEVDRIRRGLANGYALRPHTGISTGTRVRVCNGMFEGMEGIVSELRRNCSVIIRLSTVEQYFSLEADLDDLEVLGKTVGEVVKQPPGLRRQVKQFRAV